MSKELKFFFPISKFSYFILGFLLSERIQNLFYDIKILLISLIILFILSFINRIFIQFTLGFTFGFIYFFYLFFYSIPINFKSYDFLKKNQIIHITPIRKFHKNYWIYQFQNKNLNKEFIVKLKSNKKEYLNHLTCKSPSIQIQHQAYNEFFYFLAKYYYTYLTIDEKKCKIIEKTQILQNQIKNKIQSVFQKSGQSQIVENISMALLFGDSSYLDYDFKNQVKKGGILHLFAASGLHIGIIFGIQLRILKMLRFNFYFIYILPLISTFFYIWILGFPVSLLRAYSFIFIFCLKTILYRKLNPIDLVIYSIFFLFFISPQSFFSVSFLLSYGAILGIFYFTKIFNLIYDFQRFNSFKQIIIVSFSASLGTLPALIIYFKSFSFGSIFSNIILVPLTSFTLPLIYFSVFLEIIKFKFIKEILWSNIDFLLKLNSFLSEYLAQNFGFYIEFNRKFSFFFLKLYFIFIISILIFYIFYIFYKNNFSKKILLITKIFFLIYIIIFFTTTYHFMKKSPKKNDFLLKAHKNLFLYKNKDQIILKGECKYQYKFLSSNFGYNKPICKNNYKEIYFESEHCLQYLMRCSKEIYKNSSFLVTQKKVLDWQQFYPNIHFKLYKKIKKIKISKQIAFIFYNPKEDSFKKLLEFNLQDQGFIFLYLNRFSKDSVDDWNELKLKIGLKEKWEFILPKQFRKISQKIKKKERLYNSIHL